MEIGAFYSEAAHTAKLVAHAAVAMLRASARGELRANSILAQGEASGKAEWQRKWERQAPEMEAAMLGVLSGDAAAHEP